MSSASERPAKPTRGILVLLDRERRFRYSLATLEEISVEFGANALSSGLTGSKLAKVLWYGLKHEDPELTPTMIEDLVDMENLPTVIEAMKLAMGTKAKEAMAAVPLVETAPVPPVDEAPPAE